RVRYAVCQVEIVDGKKCEKTCTFIGNYAIHLANNHRITKQTEQKVNPCRLLELKDYIRILEANLAEKVDQNSKKDSQQLSKIMLTNNEYIMKPLIAEIIKNLKPESESNTTNINIEKIEDIFF
ncbi:15552_t:CDS:2, partial [Funneliformis geosporum]